jgi:tetratricopeptide (TPR) repeat protein
MAVFPSAFLAYRRIRRRLIVNDARRDEELVARLLQARQVDLETLLAFEPRYHEREFIEGLLSRLDDKPELLTVAHEVLRRALKRNANWLPSYAELAMRRIEFFDGNRARVSDILNDLEQVAHQHGEKEILLTARYTRLSIALAEYDVGDILHAAQALIDALEPIDLDPALSEYRSELSSVLIEAAAHAYYKAEDPDTTSRFADAARRLDEHPNALRLEALGDMARGATKRAREWLARLAERGEADDADLFNLGNCELTLGNEDAAIAALRTAAILNPDNGAYSVCAAMTMASVGKAEEAERILVEALPA